MLMPIAVLSLGVSYMLGRSIIRIKTFKRCKDMMTCRKGIMDSIKVQGNSSAKKCLPNAYMLAHRVDKTVTCLNLWLCVMVV